MFKHVVSIESYVCVGAHGEDNIPFNKYAICNIQYTQHKHLVMQISLTV